jgi:hypothetical protein
VAAPARTFVPLNCLGLVHSIRSGQIDSVAFCPSMCDLNRNKGTFIGFLVVTQARIEPFPNRSRRRARKGMAATDSAQIVRPRRLEVRAHAIRRTGRGPVHVMALNWRVDGPMRLL